METHQAPPPSSNPPRRPRRPRCHYVSANGIRCRYSAISETAQLCKRHLAPNPNDPVTMDSIWQDLAEKGGSLDTAQNVKDSLSILFYCLVEGKITERRAGILCYILQSVLHAQRLMSKRENPYMRNGQYDLHRILPACMLDDDNDKTKTAAADAKAAESPSPATAADASAETQNTSAASPASADTLHSAAALPAAALQSPQEHTKDTAPSRPVSVSPPPPSATKPAPAVPRPTMNYASSMTPPYIPQWPLPRPTPTEQAELDAFDRLPGGPRGRPIARPFRSRGFGRPNATWRGG
jgi:hypothetical protein